MLCHANGAERHQWLVKVILHNHPLNPNKLWSTCSFLDRPFLERSMVFCLLQKEHVVVVFFFLGQWAVFKWFSINGYRQVICNQKKKTANILRGFLFFNPKLKCPPVGHYFNLIQLSFRYFYKKDILQKEKKGKLRTLSIQYSAWREDYLRRKSTLRTVSLYTVVLFCALMEFFLKFHLTYLVREEFLNANSYGWNVKSN